MEEKTEEKEPQTNPETEVEKTEEAPKAEITSEEIDDLKHRAEVSSQNFERAKKAEARIKELEKETLSDNDKLSEIDDEEISKLKDDLSTVKDELAKGKVLERYPDLKEVWSEFDEFRTDDENKGMNLNTAAKAFAIEKGLLEPNRKGLEKSTGGDKAPAPSGMTAEEVKNLRENDYNKYRDMLKKGQIKMS